ncbi:chemotaxis protein CheW [Clostridium frigidicarnis]|uniref:Purine-binding chemotaxis protein CheW n=1 Tax=Clostridium frigidicarnis TaxID=84698 RepID=A0A1I0ZCM6_9CLOT|nr:chemotaxis protein CheW [Clostridium frigidicarnis]SFB23271.1 purine-binding chemotaxis protein CheW [Clostridium frigidicarnis]
MQVLIFKLTDEHFAVETSKVQVINDMMEVTRVPKAPSYINGLINLRGNIISLLDINLLLNIEKNLEAEENIIILNMEDEQVGICVDEVEEVVEVNEDKLETLKDEKSQNYIKGIINFGDKIVTMIDIDKLI